MSTRKVIFQNPAGLKIFGILHDPHEKTEKVIIMSHGFAGNRDEHGGFQKAAEAFLEEGYAALRFDFTGSGESSPTDITLEKQVTDLKQVITFVQQVGYKDIALLGHSLGGLCSLKAWDERIKTMILHAPVTKPYIPQRLLGERVKDNFEKKGYTIIEDSTGGRLRIDRQFVQELQSINQQDFSAVTCPTLFIHGSSDESVSVGSSRSAASLLRDAKLEVIMGKGHDFKDHADTVISLCLEWIKKYL